MKAEDFEGDAFISYAHLDNIELIEGRKGWVANLHRALEVRVGMLLGKSPHIWRDPKLAGNDLFAETLVEKLKHVAVLVTVVSPRYLKSEWTMRELKEFLSAAEEQGGIRVGDKARVFKVLKTPVPIDKTPPELRALLGYEFFKVDPETGKIRELDEVFGPEAQRDFWLKLDDLAHDVVALLELIHEGESAIAQATAAALAAGQTAAQERASAGAASAPAGERSPRPTPAEIAEAQPAAAPSRGTVYLAETTSDLKEYRDQLRRDLQQHGYAVLPDTPIPLVATEAFTVISEMLARSQMSIHLIGKYYSLVPEGGMASLIELQHELATEVAEQKDFARLIWLPQGQQVLDGRQKHVIETLRVDPRIQGRADLLESTFEDLRTLSQEWLKRDRKPPAPAAAPEPGSVRQLYLIAEQRDAEAIAPWADALFEQHFEVIQPVFDGDEAELRQYHEENLTHCDGVLIFYGAGNAMWLNRKLREVQKAPGYGRTKPRPVVGVALIGPRTPEKERLRSHEAIVMPQWEGCDARALEPFVTQLKADAPV